MRSPSDAVRDRAHAALLATLQRDRRPARRRRSDADTYQENAATALDPARHRGREPRPSPPAASSRCELSSGAGHDAMIMARLCPSGMIFLRCKDGISHNPAESITVEDADLGVQAMLEAVRRLDRRME